MEKVVLGVILVAAVLVLARIVWRSVSAANDGSKPPSCSGCPFDSKCEMQDRPKMTDCGGAGDDV